MSRSSQSTGKTPLSVTVAIVLPSAMAYTTGPSPESFTAQMTPSWRRDAAIPEISMRAGSSISPMRSGLR